MVSSNSDEQKLKRITIKTETRSKWFDDPEKLLSWVQQQWQLYSFHKNISQRHQLNNLFAGFDSSWSNLQQKIVNGLRRFINEPNNYNSHADQFIKSFATMLRNKQIFTEEAPFYGFVKRQADKKAEYGVAAIAVMFDANISQLDSVMLEGVIEAKAYSDGSPDRVKDERDSLQKLKERWDEELTNHKSNWVSEYQVKIDEASEQNKRADDLIAQWIEHTKSQSEELQSHKEEFKKKFDEEVNKASTDLENLTKTYDDKLALHAAVKYWGLQQESNLKKAIGFGIAMGVMVIVVVLTLINFVDNNLNVTIKEVAVNKLITVAIITTFGIWLIKVAANIFMSHLHLATDAQERRTMIHTYLALTRKGQGPKEEDRQLILQTLFRPSATDMVKNDQGPTQLVDIINRLSPKN